MLADRRILAVRRGESAALAISSLTLVDEGGKAAVLPSLHGTLTALSDAGCSDEEAWRWLTAANDELGERPIDALRAGRVHAVRRAAATLAFRRRPRLRAEPRGRSAPRFLGDSR